MNMNVREGVRRLGLLLGACGAILGAFLAYTDAKQTWERFTSHNRFQSVMAGSPTMQKVAAAHGTVFLFLNSGNEEIGRLTYEDGTIRETEPRSTMPELPPGATPMYILLVNRDGIKEVGIGEDGLVHSVELSTGETVISVDPPPLKAYLVPLLYPILGFLLPWGAIRVLTWVASGFVPQRN
jgi:hypothetical protein